MVFRFWSDRPGRLFEEDKEYIQSSRAGYLSQETDYNDKAEQQRRNLEMPQNGSLKPMCIYMKTRNCDWGKELNCLLMIFHVLVKDLSASWRSRSIRSNTKHNLLVLPWIIIGGR